jgi:transglutaminase-like putative cysteine protease
MPAPQASRRLRAWLGATIGAAVGLCALQFAPGLVTLLVPLALSVVVPARWRAGRAAELVATLVALGGGVLLVAALGVDVGRFRGPLAALAAPAAVGSLLLATLRAWLAEPRGGVLGTLATALVAVTAAGAMPLDRGYVAGSILFVALALAALRAATTGRASLRELPRRHRLAGGASVGISALLATTSATVLPPLYAWTTTLRFGGDSGADKATGFAEGDLSLGALDGMFQSDKVVLRVFGAKIGEHLRGAVYTRYQNGRWHMEGRAAGHALPPPGHATAEAVTVEILNARPGPLFLPLGASAVSAGGVALRVDAYALVRPMSTEVPARYTFTRGDDRSAIASPGPSDLEVPEHLREPLARIAAEWTAGATTPRERLAALVQHLERGYVYSLHFDRKWGADPLLDFLQRSRRGHCQYFASALALLARSAGIPARVAGGFIVAERQGPWGYASVRAWSAHAWVEAALPDSGWITVDPVPQLSTEPSLEARASWLARLREALAYWGSRATSGVDALRGSLIPIGGGALAVVLLAWLLRRAWRQRPARRSGGDPAIVDPPLPVGRALFDVLRAHGVERRAGETLEALSLRLPSTDLPPSLALAITPLLQEYCALRYGGVGDPARLARAVATLNAAASAPPAGPTPARSR